MSATVIDGKAIAAEVVETVTRATAKLKAETGVTPGIAVVIIGEDPASQVYVKSKGKRAAETIRSSGSRTREKKAAGVGTKKASKTGFY